MKLRAEFMRGTFRAPALLLLIAISIVGGLSSLHSAEDQQPFGIDHRIPWTTSRVFGSPDPLPYTVEKVFTNITWKEPLFVTPEPGSNRLMVVLGGAEKE